MNKYQYLLFDLDHTLWDFERNSLEALKELFEEYQLENHFDDFNNFQNIYHSINSMLWSLYGRGKISKDIVKYERFSATLKKAGLDNPSLAKTIADEYVAISPCKTHLINGSLEVLETLYGKYKMFLITNGFNEVQFKKISFSGLKKYFERVFTSEDAGYQKPAQEFFDYVFADGHIKPEGSLVIGDNLITDIGGAKSYGIDTVFFNPNLEKDFIGADYNITKLEELLSIL